MPSVPRWKRQLRTDPELRAKLELLLTLRRDRDARLAFHDSVILSSLIEEDRKGRGGRRARRGRPPVPELPESLPTPKTAHTLPLDVRLRLIQQLMAERAIFDAINDERLQNENPTDLLGVEFDPRFW